MTAQPDLRRGQELPGRKAAVRGELILLGGLLPRQASRHQIRKRFSRMIVDDCRTHVKRLRFRRQDRRQRSPILLLHEDPGQRVNRTVRGVRHVRLVDQPMASGNRRRNRTHIRTRRRLPAQRCARHRDLLKEGEHRTDTGGDDLREDGRRASPVRLQQIPVLRRIPQTFLRMDGICRSADGAGR